MKKNLFLTLTLLVFGFMGLLFVSCGGDDDSNGGGRDSNVIGIWIMDNATYKFSCGWQFNADGSCAFGEWSYQGTPRFPDANGVTWSTSGNTLSIHAGSESASFTYSISKDGKTLILTVISRGDDYSEMEGTYTKQ